MMMAEVMMMIKMMMAAPSPLGWQPHLVILQWHERGLNRTNEWVHVKMSAICRHVDDVARRTGILVYYQPLRGKKKNKTFFFFFFFTLPVLKLTSLCDSRGSVEGKKHSQWEASPAWQRGPFFKQRPPTKINAKMNRSELFTYLSLWNSSNASSHAAAEK